MRLKCDEIRNRLTLPFDLTIDWSIGATVESVSAKYVQNNYIHLDRIHEFPQKKGKTVRTLRVQMCQ